MDGPYGGAYTQEQMKEIVAYCAERYIEVVPEFDMPGHTSALLAAHPALSCTGGPFQVQTKQGIFKDILCAGKEETFRLIFDVLEEMLAVFPSRYIHIGGDEAPKARWKACPDCQARMREEGLSSLQALQGYFMNRIISWLGDRGGRLLSGTNPCVAATLPPLPWCRCGWIKTGNARAGQMVAANSSYPIFIITIVTTPMR